MQRIKKHKLTEEMITTLAQKGVSLADMRKVFSYGYGLCKKRDQTGVKPDVITEDVPKGEVPTGSICFEEDEK